jgi:hypothetical protein
MSCGDPAVSSVEVWQVATPLLSVWTPVPPFVQVIVVPLSLKVAVPAGGPVTAVADATVAVNVTFCPALDGFEEEETVVVVPDLLTT